MANLTGSDIFTAVGISLHDISDVTDDQKLLWLNYMNQFFYRAVSSQDPSRWVTTTNFTASGSPSTHALPITFESMTGSGQGVFRIDGNGNAYGEPLGQVDYGNTGAGYRIEGDNLILQNLSGSTVKMRYLPLLDELTDLNDETLIPFRFKFWAASAIKQMYFADNEDQAGEYSESAKVSQALNEVYKFFPRTNKFITNRVSLTRGFTRF